MAGEKVLVKQPMTYNGVSRYKDEVFALIGARNDDALVRVGHVRPYDGPTVRDDYSGREFASQQGLNSYRIEAPKDAVVIRRGPGRPKGSTNKAKASA
jgi:hypothetical protein